MILSDQDACEEGESRQLLVLRQRLAAGPGALLVAVCGGASPDPGQGRDLPSRRVQLQRPHCSLQVTALVIMSETRNMLFDFQFPSD